jgi:hypothetical protein
MQKGFTALSILKLATVSLYGIYVDQCPWPDQISNRYLMMALVVISTVYQTWLITFLMFLGKGWKVAHQRMERPDMTNITLMMCTTYLLYSSYYISLNSSATLRFFISFIMNIMFLILAMMVT